MTREQIKKLLLETARECYQRGPGWAQQGVVMRSAKEKLALSSIEDEQQVLDCWHELFRDGKIGWGYNLDNPDRPFFHLPVKVPAAV